MRSGHRESPADVVALVERLRRAGFGAMSERGSGAVDHLVECRSTRSAVRLSADRGQWWAERSEKLEIVGWSELCDTHEEAARTERSGGDVNAQSS